MKRVVLLLLALCLPACARELKPDEKCGFLLNNGQRISWGERKIYIYITKSVPANFHDAIRSAVRTMNSAIDGAIILQESTMQENAYGDVVNSICYGCKELGPLEQAQALLRWTGAYMLEADVVLGTRFKLSATPSLNEIDAESLVLHELGHAVGLDHSDERNSIMYPTLFYGEIRRGLSEKDLKNLRCGYSL